MPETLTSPAITEGCCSVFFAFDIGLSVNLDRATQRIGDARGPLRLRHTQRAPQYFDYDPPPLKVVQKGKQITFGNGAVTNENVEATIFDFGAISVAYSIDLSGALSDLVPLSALLYENPVLLADARTRAQQICSQMRDAIERFEFDEVYENYTFFDLRRLDREMPIPQLIDAEAQNLGQILRCEVEPLAPTELAEALSARLSYQPGDAVLIDWNTAVSFGKEAEDIRAVLEFANVELVEMRRLDKHLDAALERAYQAMTKGKKTRADLRTVAQLQVDGAIMFEAVNNALKLLGDQYLARVYSLVSKRFHLHEWDASVLRKLDILNSIYTKISGKSAEKRMEFLEVIIIVLFMLDILVAVLFAKS